MAMTSRLRPEQKYAAEAQDTIDHFLGLIDGISLKAARPDQGGAKVPTSRFDRAVLINEFNEIMGEDGFILDSDIFDAAWPIHSRILVRAASDSEDVCVLRALDSVSPREVRGRVRRLMPHMARYSSAHIRPTGAGITTEVYYGVKPDGSLVDISNVNDMDPARMSDAHMMMLRCLASLALYMEYSWSVDIRAIGSNFTMRIPTSSQGARKILSLRDVAPGHERRRALKHWVEAHTRRIAKEDADHEVDVRSHLRGVTPFKWEDFEGAVRPSPYDLKRAV